MLMSKNNEEIPPPIEESSIKDDKQQSVLIPSTQMVMLDDLTLDNFNNLIFTNAPPIK